MTTSWKPGDFLAEPWGKRQRGVLGRKLEERGSGKACVVLGWLLVLKKDEDPFWEWLKATWHQWQAVLALPQVPWSVGQHLLMMLCGEPPIPAPSLNFQNLQLGWGSSHVPRKEMIVVFSPLMSSRVFGAILSPQHFNFWRNSRSFMHYPSSSPASFRSIIISFSEWIPGPFPYLHPHLWSVLCHWASLLVE